ncbi:hypothetical protein HDU98_005716 [Podochytrium sp. JEL0797]|nr:hypothetical protein HDU98_005716 [Podochytrium sp. JEL0797]
MTLPVKYGRNSNGQLSSGSQQTDTLIINEIVVLESAQGQGVAGKMLELMVSQTDLQHLTEIEFSVLSSNLASETMFTKFAERQVAGRQGGSISFGNVSKSEWGSYIDWTLKLAAKAPLAVAEGKKGGKSRLEILVPWMDTLLALSNGGTCFQERQGVIKRAKLTQQQK